MCLGIGVKISALQREHETQLYTDASEDGLGGTLLQKQTDNY